MSAPIRVLIADDHVIVREGIRRVLGAARDVEVVAEAGDGTEALAMVRAHAPDVIVLDLTMPGVSGLHVATQLWRERSRVRVLILSMHNHPEYVLEAVRAGAHGYVLKDADPDELRRAVRTVHEGREYFSPAVAGQLSAALRGEIERERRKSGAQALTPREREVLVGVTSGRTNKEIAVQLGISPRTVESHRDAIARKLGMRSVAELTRFVLEHGLSDGGAGVP
jgi:DNA-binding NarL/FixJ family response regulator